MTVILFFSFRLSINFGLKENFRIKNFRAAIAAGNLRWVRESDERRCCCRCRCSCRPCPSRPCCTGDPFLHPMHWGGFWNVQTRKGNVTKISQKQKKATKNKTVEMACVLFLNRKRNFCRIFECKEETRMIRVIC